MAKVRITAWAKEHHKSSVYIVKTLTQKGYKIRNQASLIDESVLEELFLDASKPKLKNKEEAKTVVIAQAGDHHNDSDNKPVRKYSNNNTNNSGYRSNNNTNNNGYRSNNNTNNNGYRSNNNTNNNGYRSNNNSNNSGYRSNNNTSGNGYRSNNNTSGNGYRSNNNTSGNGYRSNNNTGGNGYRSNNNTSGNGYRSNNNTGGNGYRSNNNTGGNGYRSNNFNKPGYKPNNKPDTEKTSTIEQKDIAKKKTKQNSSKKKPQFDRFKIFDKEKKTIMDNGKTKTQLKKEEREKRKLDAQKEEKTIKWTGDITVGTFAQKLDIPATDLIAKLFELGIMSTMNQILDRDHAEIIGADYNVAIIDDDSNEDLEFASLMPQYDESMVVKRPPIVTIMGHVDHGKTTLLDSLRDENVAAKEAGGITQHIGAYQIEKKGFKVTFLDTPGHEAFTAMRARGADITDIVIIVVAADDGVMPQTKEAVAHALESKNPIIVAVNKMDKPGANPERVMTELAELGIQSEDWGGEVPFVKISALKKEGLDELIDYIKVISDINDYKAVADSRGFGTVIEAHLDKGRGPVATVLVQGGKLELKDSIIIGDTWGSIRVMQDEYSNRHKSVGASMPVEITGLKDVPQAGDQFVVMEDAKEAQAIGEKRAALKEVKDRNRAHAMTLDELNKKISQGDISELPILIKSDVQGSVEALSASLEKIDVDGVKVRIIHRGVGQINESDVMLAQAAGGMIIGFNVRPDANSRRLIEKENIELMLDNVIYKIIENIEDAMKGLRKTEMKQKIEGYARVDQVFKITGVGKIAGAVCTEGKLIANAKLRLVRDGIVLYDGEIGQLKRFKDDAKEIVEGQDCGISFKNYNDIKKGDELECYTETEEFVQYDKVEE